MTEIYVEIAKVVLPGLIGASGGYFIKNWDVRRQQRKEENDLWAVQRQSHWSPLLRATSDLKARFDHLRDVYEKPGFNPASVSADFRELSTYSARSSVHWDLAPDMSVPRTNLDHAYDYNEPAPTASFTQALRKYPMYAVINVRSPSASSIYHALQLSLEKRFSNGLSFLSGYTYSKSIDDASLWNGSVVDVTNFHLERGLSTFDTRHRFITSYTYDLPYGHGRAFGSKSPAVLKFAARRMADQWHRHDSIRRSSRPYHGAAALGHTDRHAAGRNLQS